MDIPEISEKTGLNQKEAMVYMALLELGTASVESIALKAGTKRPTTYLILDELQRKGLATLIPRAKKVLYMPESPEKLISDLARKQELVKRFLPDMLAVYNEPKDKPQVQLFSGSEGVRQVYQQIFESTQVDFFGTVCEVQKIYPEGLEEFVKKVKQNKLKIRDLLTRSEKDLEYARQAETENNYQIRFVKQGMDFPTDSAIFSDQVAFFSFHPQVFVVLIKSLSIVQSLKTLFEMAWANADNTTKIHDREKV